MKNKIMTFILAIAAISVHAQKVTFISEEFKTGVKTHLGLGDKDEVQQAQTDTITIIDLSGLEIVDISDVSYMPNVKWIDFGDNMIEDVTPLASLEYLHYVNLRRNALETINPLAFACTDSLYVNVAGNYIKDFSYLFSTSSCQLLLEGMGAQQQVKNAPYFNVYQLYADIVETGEPEACYRGFTNMEDGVFLACGSLSVPAVMDGYTNSVILPKDLDEATLVTLSNGEQSETTYVVPTAKYAAGAGKTITMETGLPDDYYISSAYALKGSVEIDGNRMKYTAPAKAVSDIVVFSYYQGSTLKGFSRYSVNMGKKGDVNISGIVDVQDATLAVNYILGKSSDEYDYVAADMNGDNQVDVFDVTAIINTIFNESGSLSAARSLARQEGDLEKVRLTASEDGLLIGIDRANRFTSFQFDVEVPQGTDLLDVTWNGNTKHSLQFARIGENRYRVVALSMSSAPLPASDEALLCLQLSGIPDGNVWVGNVLFVTPEGKALRLNGDTMNMTTGIQGISHTQGEQIYDISGRQLDKKREQLGKGVYIINNKKVVIK